MAAAAGNAAEEGERAGCGSVQIECLRGTRGDGLIDAERRRRESMRAVAAF